MNISLYSSRTWKTGSFHNDKTPYSYSSNNEATREAGKKLESVIAKKRTDKASESKVSVTSYTDKEGRVHKTFTGKSTSVVETMKAAKKADNEDKPKIKKHLNYSYQKVSGQVLMAKNSLSASRAVLMARRSLSELRRKIRNIDCSDDEKQAALSHAKNMLRIAKKKKKHLELEELVETTIKNDEKNSVSSENGWLHENWDMDEKEDSEDKDVLDELIGDDATKEVAEEPIDEDISEEVMSEENIPDDELLEDLTGFEEDTLEEMSEEFQELMDLMEVINPHMDEAHFEKLKLKHRCEEQKDIVKADMDYLKVYMSIESAPLESRCNVLC